MCVVCVLSIHLRLSKSKSSLLNGHSLHMSSLSRVSLSLVCLSLSLVSLSLVCLSVSLCCLSLVSLWFSVTHSCHCIYIYMLYSNWEQFSFQPVLHEAQHSFHPLITHSSIRLQTRSHSTNHSLIPQAHAIILLHSGIVEYWQQSTSHDEVMFSSRIVEQTSHKHEALIWLNKNNLNQNKAQSNWMILKLTPEQLKDTKAQATVTERHSKLKPSHKEIWYWTDALTTKHAL